MSRNTKERLLLAAVKEFAASGYAATTVRNITERAAARNLNAIVYHYGGKEELYKAVLDFMFREAEKFREDVEPSSLEHLSPGEKLASLIRFLCRAYYSIQSELDRDLYCLFAREAGNPSPYFEVMVEKHLKPVRELMLTLLGEYLGPDVSDRTIQNCEYSISGQILYGMLGDAIIRKTNPTHTSFETSVDDLADHVVRFSFAALDQFRTS